MILGGGVVNAQVDFELADVLVFIFTTLEVNILLQAYELFSS